MLSSAVNVGAEEVGSVVVGADVVDGDVDGAADEGTGVDDGTTTTLHIPHVTGQYSFNSFCCHVKSQRFGASRPTQ